MDENVIERQIELKSAVPKVWEALTDSEIFGKWFQIEFPGPFKPGKTTRGRILTKGFDLEVDFHVIEIRPQSYFSYAWAPYAIDKTFDYSKEKPTLVEFFLEKTEKGTLLRLKESGFSQITASRRAEAFKMNTGGWEAQLKNIEAFLAGQG